MKTCARSPLLSEHAEDSWHQPCAGDPGTPEAVRPIYVRAPDADLHITKMKDPWEA